MKHLKFIWLYLLSFFFSVCFAQTFQIDRLKIDRLKKILPSLKDTARIDCLLKLSYEYIDLVYTQHHTFHPYGDSALLYDSIAYEESKKLNYIHGVAESYLPKALLSVYYFADYKSTENLSKESLKWFELTPRKNNIERAYFFLASALFNQYQYEKATPYLEKCFYWAEKNKNYESIKDGLGLKYETYRDIGDYEKAFDAFKKTEELDIKLTGKKDVWYENYVLAELQRRMGNCGVALNYYRQVVAKMDLQTENIWFRVSYPELFALNGKFDSAQYYYNQIDSSECTEHDLRFYCVSIGEFYLLKKEYTRAIGYLLRGLQLHREAGDINYVKRALVAVAKTYTEMQKDGMAMAYAREALSLSLQSQAKQYIRDAYEIMYEIYQRKNEPDSAFTYYQKYVTQKEIVANDIVKGKFAAYTYDQQIQQLNNEKYLEQQHLNQATQQRTFLIMGIAGLLLLGFFLLRNIMLKRKNEATRRAIAENELLLQKFENEKTKAELEQQATELEMQALRSQMNPHFIFNSLNSINRFILQNNKTQASEYLTKFSRLVRLILQNSQSPLILLESELNALNLYLELEALRFDNHFNYKITVDKELDTLAIKVPPLLIQPYVENAIWHGLMHKEERGNLDIQLYDENDMLCCKITDDGVGRKKATELKSKSAPAHKSMGMQITASRIAIMNQDKQSGTHIKITDLVLPDGKPGGTEVLLKIPVYYD